MSGAGRTTMKLPRLRTKEELLKTSPEIFNKLLLGDDMSTARSTAPAAAAAQQQAGKLARPVQSAGRQGSPQRTASRGGQLGGASAAMYDTPRGFGDEPLSVDQELAVELESVKRERNQLMDSIAHVRAAAGTAGGEAQQADIRQLLKELEVKKAKLNELKGDSRATEAGIAKIRDDDTDAQRLTPDDCVEENNYIQCLNDEMAQVEEDLLEGDAKNRLYSLLAERTRREHMAIDQKVRDKQECLRACNEDLANLTEHFNATRAAKELAQKELARVKRQVEEARNDWTRKTRERRAEVNELQRRQRKEHEKEVRRREKLQEKEKTERTAAAKLRMEEEAYQLQVAALAPKIEAMEASWNRLRAISGAETPEQVIDYWRGLQDKEARMKELVALAERRESACKAEVTQLLASRSTMYETGSSSSSGGGGGGGGSAAAVGVAAAAAEAAAKAAEAEAAAQQEAAGEAPNGGQQEDDEEEERPTAEAAAARIAEAARRMEAAQLQFNKLRGICVGAEQGMRSLAQRLGLALEAPAAMPADAGEAAAACAGHQGQQGLPGNSPGSRLTSAGGMSTTSGSHVGAEAMRRSGAGGGSGPGHHRSGSRDHGAAGAEAFGANNNALASKAQRLTSSAARGRGGSNALDRTGSGASHTANGLPLVPEDSTGSRQQLRGSTDSAGVPHHGPASLALQGVLPGSGLAAAAPGSSSGGSRRPVLPSRGRNTIDDDSFFEGLPQLLDDVTAKLEALLASGSGLDLAAITAAAAAGGLLGGGSGSSATSSAASTARRRSGGTAEPTPRSAGVQSTASGLLSAAVEAAGQGNSAAAAAGGDEAAAVAAAAAASSASETVSAAAERSSEAADADADPSRQPAGVDGEAAAEEAVAGEGGGDPTTESAEQQGEPAAAASEAVEWAAEAAEPTAAAGATGSDQAQHAAGGDGAPASGAGAGPAATTSAASAAASGDAPAGASSTQTAAGAGQPVAAAGGTGSSSSSGSTSAAAAAAPTSSSFVATQSPSMAGCTARSSVLLNEKALLKGMHRRTWVGAPWLEAVSDNPLDVKLVPSMKRKKGKKKEATAGPDLTRILGYTPPSDVPAESESDGDDAGAGEAAGADTVVDREWIKMRAAKLTARHNAKAAAAAAVAQSQSGGR